MFIEVQKILGVALGVLVFNRGGTFPRSGVERCPRIYSLMPRSGRPSRLIETGNFQTAGACSCWSKPPAASSGGGSAACEVNENLFGIDCFPQVSIAEARAARDKRVPWSSKASILLMSGSRSSSEPGGAGGTQARKGKLVRQGGAGVPDRDQTCLRARFLPYERIPHQEVPVSQVWRDANERHRREANSSATGRMLGSRCLGSYASQRRSFNHLRILVCQRQI